MEPLQFEEAHIETLNLKTNKKSGDDVGKCSVTAPCTVEIARALGCFGAVYAKDEKPITNFRGHTLKLKIVDVKMGLSPLAGGPLDLDVPKVRNFSIYPTEEGLEIGFDFTIEKNLKRACAFKVDQGASPVTLLLTPAQETLPLAEENGSPKDGTEPAADQQTETPAGEAAPKKRSRPSKATTTKQPATKKSGSVPIRTVKPRK